jgi:hypothetical protein
MDSNKLEFNGRLLRVYLAISFMHQLSNNSLSNHYHWHLARYHLAYYYHLAFLHASDSDASAEDL